VTLSLPVMGTLGGEIAHLPFDHAWVATVTSRDVQFASHLLQKTLVVIIMIGQGEKTPVSISWIG
jgi:hypothetical protein